MEEQKYHQNLGTGEGLKFRLILRDVSILMLAKELLKTIIILKVTVLKDTLEYYVLNVNKDTLEAARFNAPNVQHNGKIFLF